MLSPNGADLYGLPFQWLLVAWTAVWLVSPWLARRSAVVALTLALGLAALVGAAGEVGASGRLAFTISLTDYAVWVFALGIAFVLSGLSCRRTYRPRRFLAWLVPWLIVGAAVGVTCKMLLVLAPRFFDQHAVKPPALLLLSVLALVSLGTAGALYLLNLPFMYLAFRYPLYRDRFHKLLRLPESVPPAATSSDASTGGQCELP